jgi:hypothetical protein
MNFIAVKGDNRDAVRMECTVAHEDLMPSYALGEVALGHCVIDHLPIASRFPQTSRHHQTGRYNCQLSVLQQQAREIDVGRKFNKHVAIWMVMQSTRNLGEYFIRGWRGAFNWSGEVKLIYFRQAG